MPIRHQSADTASSSASPAVRSPFAIIWLFAAIVLCLLLLANFSIGVLSSVRAYVGGESQWSRAQKDAVFHLQKYAVNGDPDEFRRFRSAIAVPLGDREARIEMDRPKPDMRRVLEGFELGGNHRDDVDGMFNLYRRFHRVGFMQRATQAWESGDRDIVLLDAAGTRLQRAILSPDSGGKKIQSILEDISSINEHLTPIEDRFVDALSQAARQMYRLLQWTMLAATPVLLILATALSLRILRQRQLTDERLRYMAFHDDLTALPNRALLNERLRLALDRHRRTGAHLAILFMDVDRFKVINDSLGHEIGNDLLRQIADRLRAQSARGDTIARVGGDEFVALITDQGSQADIAARAGELVRRLSAPYLLGRNECHVSVSVGISIFPSDGDHPSALLKAADVAMYRAKEVGRSNCQYYLPSMNVHTVERLELESDLSRALERGELLLNYQPIVDVATGIITGTEALLRWNHPLRGLLMPLEFIPLAEETGLIVPIGEWVLAAACRQNKAWHDQGLTNLRVAVNLSARQFSDPSLLPNLTKIIESSGLDPSTLQLEITESAVMSQGECAVTVLGGLKSLGVAIAIDDFGTGYSSLAYLKRFPIDIIKVDRSFIRDIPADAGDMKITRAIIALAHGLRLKVVAEGVETAAQLKFLLTLRCDAAQGYFLHRPLPMNEVTPVLILNRTHSAPQLAVPA